MDESNDLFAKKEIISESESNDNVPDNDEKENTIVTDESQNVEEEDKSLDLAVENLVHDEPYFAPLNLQQELNFGHEEELREINVQNEQTSESTENTAAENISSRLPNVLGACTQREIPLNELLQRLLFRVRRRVPFRYLTRLASLGIRLSQLRPFCHVLLRILSVIKASMLRALNDGDNLTDMFNTIMTICDDIEVTFRRLMALRRRNRHTQRYDFT